MLPLWKLFLDWLKIFCRHGQKFLKENWNTSNATFHFYYTWRKKLKFVQLEYSIVFIPKFKYKVAMHKWWWALKTATFYSTFKASWSIYFKQANI